MASILARRSKGRRNHPDSPRSVHTTVSRVKVAIRHRAGFVSNQGSNDLTVFLACVQLPCQSGESTPDATLINAGSRTQAMFEFLFDIPMPSVVI
jgi:hypothetical protein